MCELYILINLTDTIVTNIDTINVTHIWLANSLSSDIDKYSFKHFNIVTVISSKYKWR